MDVCHPPACLASMIAQQPYCFRCACWFPAECDEIIRVSKPRIVRSGVANSETGASTFSDIRTSSGMFFGREETSVISSVEQRLARWTMLPLENGEGIQVLYYEVGCRCCSGVSVRCVCGRRGKWDVNLGECGGG